MKQKATRLLAAFLSFVMVLSMFATAPITTYAAETTEEVSTYKTESSTLAPGITQDISYAYCADGAYLKYYVAVADLSNQYVGLHTSYKDAQCETSGMQVMTEQAAALENLHSNPDDTVNYIPNYAIVAGINGDGYNTSTGKPSGALVMNGVSGLGIVKSANSPWFALFEDGTAACGRNNTDWDAAVAEHGAVKEAIGGFQLMRKDGIDVAPGTAGGSTYINTGRYPRSFIGVTADNKVVMVNTDGNNAGGSCGTDYAEAMEILVDDYGCVDILCLDGGGSGTYISRPEGSDEIEVTNIPSDGSPRTVANGIVFYTTVPASDTFDRASITVDSIYVAPGASTKVSAIGVSPAGTPAEIPEGATWESDMGTVNDGVFVAGSEEGTGKISLMLDGKEVGSLTIYVYHPDKLSFKNDAVTVPYGKTVSMEIIPTYGMNTVAVLDSQIVLSLSDAGLGSTNGKEFTANDGTSGVTEGTMTATYIATGLTGTVTINLGRGSEILENFEDNATDITAVPIYDEGETASAEIVTSENGQVRNGTYALAVHADFSNYLWDGLGGIKLIDFTKNGMAGIKNAVAIGFWIYFPEDFIGTYASWRIQRAGSTSKNDRTVADVYHVGVPTAAEKPGWYYFSVPTDTFLQNENGFDIGELHFYIDDSYDQPGFDASADLGVSGEYTFYIDDITVDYSSAVEDRENPTFESITYAVSGMSDAAALNGNTINTNIVDIAAKVSDFEADNMVGLDYSTAQAIIDGVDVTDTMLTVSEGYLTLSQMTLTEGVHTIRFNICDKNGNPATIERYIVVDTADNTPTISIEMQDPTADKLLAGSVHYFDIKVNGMADIQKLQTVINMNGINDWCLEQMVVSKGFDVTTSLEPTTNDVTFTFTRNDVPISADETLLASIPVRIWYTSEFLCRWARHLNLSTDYGVITTADGTEVTFAMNPIEIDTESDRSGYLYSATDAYLDTHKHVAGTAVSKDATCTENGYIDAVFCVGCACETDPEDDGVINCQHESAGCGSVIDWGTTIPATGHTFEITDGVLKCDCGVVFTGVYSDGKTYVDGVIMADGWNGDNYWVDGVKLTGVQLVDGFYYNFGVDGVCEGKTKLTGKFYNESVNGYCYAVSGELQAGWYLVDDVWNYYSWTDMTAITGTYTFQNGACTGITYVFDDEGNLTNGVWHTTEDGNIQYFYGPDCYKWSNNILQEIDGKTYCFDKDGYLYRGLQIVRIGAFADYKLYHFDSLTGELIKVYENETGIYPVEGGNYCYLVNGVVQKGLGMITFDGSDYYVRGNGLLAVGKYYVGAGYVGCDHLTPGYYNFGDDAKFVGAWIDENAFTGIKADDEGNLHYYVNDAIQYGLGMITVDGSNYYVRGNGLLALGKYWLDSTYKGCSDMSAGYYDFGEDGKFVGIWQETVDPDLFTGIKADEEGNLHYYLNEVIQYGLGMITIDGADYYVRGNGLIAVGKYYIGAGYTGCGHLTPGYYDFGEDGKFVGVWQDTVVPDVFTGIKADAEGNLRYYVNDVIQYGLGMITIDGADYYVRGNGLIAVGKYYVGAGYTGCEHLTPGYYDFGEDGKFVGPWVE